MKKNILFIAIVCIFSSCNRYTHVFADEKDILKPEAKSTPVLCDQSLAYAPDNNHPEYTPIRYIRVNFHIMQSSDGTGNFNDQEAKQYVAELIDQCNYNLAHNIAMNLPAGNTTPALETRFRIVLVGDSNTGEDGIYFHRDDSTCFFVKNKKKGTFSLNDQEPFKYKVGDDSIINIFLLDHHPDSIAANPNYNPTASGVSFGHDVKLFGAYYNRYHDFTDGSGNIFHKGAQTYKGLLNHEIGHSLGLSHTWNMDDGCDDTPKNPGCWSETESPPCNGAVSDNMMDYNNCQCAISPCQLGKIHYNMWREGSPQRKLLVQDWCSYHPFQTITINKYENIIWNNGKDLLGDIIVKEGATLTISCMVSLPEKAKIIVMPGAVLVIDGGTVTNRCGNNWEGIEIWKNKKTGQVGAVQFVNGGFINHVTNFKVLEN